MAVITRPIDLNSKYDLTEGRILLTGVQALVRLPITRSEIDRAAGLHTAGFISGYRGSPLGGYDTQLMAAKSRLDAHDVVVRPAVNEDLAATAVWGSQQVGLYPGARFEGVFGLWYGKSPGVDRSGDAFRHANQAGSSPHGGVLAVAGDDHAAKSSSIVGQSEFAFMDAEIPVLAPASVEEVLTFGVKAYDISRFAGLWVAMTTVSDIMDAAASVDVDMARYRIRPPTGVRFPADGVHIRVPDTPLAQEVRHREFRLPAALAFVAVNGFDITPLDGPNAEFGILAAGKAYVNLSQALTDLGIDEATARRLRIRLYKPGLVWPLEPTGARAFVRGLREVLVIEEKRPLVENQLKQLCYGLADQPLIVGKRDEAGRPLVKETGELSAGEIARVLYARLPADQRTPQMTAHIAKLDAAEAVPASLHERSPFYCSGCPHNTSTVVPDGSRALAGIGCHYMVQTMPRHTSSFTQMGAEGVTWVGQAPFTSEPHVFVNLGDGTYFHSGILAIRQAVAAKVNVTYKILYNDAVAMTGGQHVDGPLTVPILVRQLLAEGVDKIVVVSDDPARTAHSGALDPSVSLRPREDLDAVQRELRGHPGVTVLVYDQPCATELRRRRKRGLAPPADTKVFINPRVCEGCGDCSTASNCIAVEPLETPFGVKRQINQSACNSDKSCLKGFCPSFVTVKGAVKSRQAAPAPVEALPDPVVPPLTAEPRNIVLAGIGGHGVTSLAAILSMAAHLDGGAAKSVDMTGLAQKGGGVFVHLRLATSPEAIPGPRVSPGDADLLLADDVVVAHGPSIAGLLSKDRSRIVLNTWFSPTSQFVDHPAMRYDVDGMRAALEATAARTFALDADHLAEEALGDAIFGQMVLAGRAWQEGLIPLSRDAIFKAIDLNGTAAARNKQAFDLGRRAAPARKAEPETFDTTIDRLAADLAAYQDRAYARRFRKAVARVAEAERRARPGSQELALTAARSLYKLMAYKDEYEVARLYADPAFQEALRHAVGEGGKLTLHLAPPLFAKLDPATGRPRKRDFGPWILKFMPALAALKRLRGTPFDPFGATAERRLERALRDQFFGVLDEIAGAAATKPFDQLIALAALPQEVRGFGPVKQAAAETYRKDLSQALASLRQASPVTAGKATLEKCNESV